jgi:hypothetical protein
MIVGEKTVKGISRAKRTRGRAEEAGYTGCEMARGQSGMYLPPLCDAQNDQDNLTTLADSSLEDD